ncbi:SpoIIE family protein phosphatase [Nocardioides campestrisoli]|uniref:SpoIIE family protein phosphatase n=1 Tax=Nocardioides campestrisoli TaxID=2736757 RepID=UPI00163D97FD|nr:SpoIIE family protein phosphatase [Nocardioides campestrisoli]
MISETSPAQSSPTGGPPASAADTPSEPSSSELGASSLAGTHRVDRLVELSARLLGASSARMTLLPDVRTVMAGLGKSAHRALMKWPEDDALCAVVVNAGGPLVVPDAASDDRVNALPAVVSGEVGSYLGAPLLADSQVIGALCVIDGEPREWRPEDLTLLEQLAETLTAELRVAALTNSQHDDRLVWQLAVDAAGVGAWDWDLRNGDLRWDDRLMDLFGTDAGSFGGTIEAFQEMVHPEDRERVGQLLSEAIATCGLFATDYRIVQPGGEVRWVTSRGNVLVGEDGKAARLVGAAFDSTAAQDGEARVTRILESMPAAFYHLDTDWRFTFVNAEAERLLGAVTTRLVDEVVWELFPETVGSEFERQYRHAITSGEHQQFEAYYPAPLDSWYEVRAWPSPDGLSVYFLDITERRRTEAELAHSAERSRLLAEVTAALTDTLDTEKGVGALAKLLVPSVADWCIVTVADGPDPLSSHDWRRDLRDLGWWHHDPAERDTLAAYAAVRIPALRDSSFQARALRSRATLLAHDARNAVVAGMEPGPAVDRYRELDPEQALFVPMIRRGRVTGLLTLGRSAERGPFTTQSVEMLNDLAGRAALALDNARAYGAQRDMAEALQRSLLTAPPRSELVEVAVRYSPAAEAAQVGGDWYDAFVRPSGDLVVVIGDVVGHDVEAAGAMGQVRGLLRGIAVTHPGTPGEVLGSVDLAMEALQVETTATVVAAAFDQTGEPGSPLKVTWSNAGHPPVLVVLPQPDGSYRVEVLSAEAPDLLLGLDADFPRDDHTTTLPVGALLLLYTDGLVERRGQDLDDGVDELCGVLLEEASRAPDLGALLDSLLERMLPPQSEDDVALVAVRVRG